MKLDHIELDRLSVSPTNMRAKRPADIANILPSVRARGILVPLLVRPNGGPESFEIVAGSRRFLAAKVVAEERGESPPLPCGILEEGDDAAAIEASLIENVARLDPDEVTRWETFTRLVKDGRSVEDIAATFGLTERLVRRVLALGNLLPRIRTLYRKELIDAATVRHLTLATKAQQRDWLALHDAPEAYAPTGHRLKEWLFGGQAIPTKAALFDLTQYRGTVVSDLFGEDSYFGDADAFWTLQREAVEAKRQSYLEAGWSAVEVLEPGTHFQSWEHEKRSRSKGGRVYIALSARGEVEVHEGWLPRGEARRLERGGTAITSPRPEMTSTLRNYVDLHRHAAVRAKLLDHPGTALRLTVAHVIVGSSLWSIRPEPQRADKPATAESVANSVSESQFAAARKAVIALLGFDADTPALVGNGGTVTEVFGRLISLSDEDVLAILSVALGETLEVGGGGVDAVGMHLQVDMAAVWQADEAFFELVRDRQALTAMVTEVAGAEVATANASEKGKALKGIITDCLSGANGRPKVDNWVPAWLRFPSSGYAGSDA